MQNFILQIQLCVLILIRCPFEPRVTAVVSKRLRSFWQKYTSQVTSISTHFVPQEQTKSIHNYAKPTHEIPSSFITTQLRLTYSRNLIQLHNYTYLLTKSELLVFRLVENFIYSRPSNASSQATSQGTTLLALLHNTHTSCTTGTNQIDLQLRLTYSRNLIQLHNYTYLLTKSKLPAFRLVQNFILQIQLCVLILIRCPFEPRVTAVVSKRPRSFWQKYTSQVTSISTHFVPQEQTRSIHNYA